MFKLPDQFHRSVFFFGLVLVVLVMPFSLYLLSVAQLLLIGNWILEGGFAQKLSRLRQSNAALALLLLYIVHLVWMLNTSDYDYGLHDLKIKLPFLGLPLVLATSPHQVNLKWLKIILTAFLLSVLAMSWLSAQKLLSYQMVAPHEFYVRLNMSHIRWSMMVGMAIFITVWLFNNTAVSWRWAIAGTFLWLIFYLFWIKVLTGLVIFLLTSIILLIRYAFRSRSLLLKWSIFSGIVILLFVITSYLYRSYNRFFAFDTIDKSKLELVTAQGNSYYHDVTSKCIENGHYIYMYVCEPELSQEWAKRSQLNFEGLARNGGELKQGLIRYLTSKGERKDALAVRRLTGCEVKLIEDGVTNYIDTCRFDLYPRIYRAMWEVYNYSHGTNPSGYSISQRIEFLKTAGHIIRDNFWFGVGTGDVPDAFRMQYIKDKSPLREECRHRAHNQLVTFFIAFGFVGFLLTLFALLAPGFYAKRYSNYLFMCIFIISFFSYFDEDTLETHHGMSFVAFFYALFLFYRNETT